MTLAYAYQKSRDKNANRARARWFIGYKDERGKHVQKATRARSKAEAMRLGQELEVRAERIRLGLEAPLPPALPFSEFADTIEREIYAHKRGHSITHYRIKRLKAHFAAAPLASIGVSEIQAFVSALAEEGLKPNTINAYLATLQGMLKHAVKRGLLAKNAAKEVERSEVPATEPRYLEIEEIRALLAFVPAYWRPITATALLTGMRTGELAGLRPENVNLAERFIRVIHNYDSPIPKGGRDRRVAITDELLPYITEALERNKRAGRVFLSAKGFPLIPNNGLAEKLRGWAKAAGIPVREDQPLQFRHLRSTYGTHAAEQAGIRFAQGALGHSSVGVTEKHYAGVRRKHEAAQAQKVRLVSDPVRTEAPEADAPKGRNRE